MPSIDERVVSMAFENAVFEQRITQTMSSLGKLEESLKKVGANQSLNDIEKSANKVTLEQPSRALDKLRSKFGRGVDAKSIEDIEKAGNKVTLEQPNKAIDKTQAKLDQLNAGRTFADIEKAADQVSLSGLTSAIQKAGDSFTFLEHIAANAFGGIASNAIMKGSAFTKGFAFGPLTDGLNEYKTNLGSIQTILANTEGQQVSGLDEVKKHLNELNTYSDQTIYNFSQMAKNIGTFTAAGVDMDTATQSIKGIANLAALSGSNSQQASTAMYQLSQAISAGRVGLQDWNSVVNAGMGGAVFQKSLMRTAVAMGKIPEEAVKIDKATGKATINGESFRNSIMAKPGQESWLTSDVLTTSLKNFTGDMTEADLVAQGFTKTQAAAVMQQAKTAKAAATEVKTLSQAFDVAKETIGSGWAKTFELIFGDFEESKKTFTEFSNALNGFINNASDARNKVLGEWKKLGGRTVLIEGIKTAFDNLMHILGAVKDAFQDVFPPATGKSLFAITSGFADLMKSLTPSEQTLENLRRIFAGVFAVLHIGYSIVKGIIGVFAELLGTVGKSSGGLLSFTGGIGDFLVAVDKALTKGGLLKSFFDGLANILKTPVTMIMSLSQALFGIFTGIDEDKAKGVGDAIGNLGAKMSPLKDVADKVSRAWQNFVTVMKDVKAFLDPWIDKFRNIASDVGNAIAASFSQANFDNVLKVIQTGLLGGLFLQFKKLLAGNIGGDIGGGLLKKLGATFQALTGHLQAMQKNVQASILLKIAAAIGVLAASALVLSTIPPEKLAKAMTAMAVGLGQLVGAMALLTKTSGKAGFIQVPAMAAGMVLLSGAVFILAGALKILSTIDWDDMAVGLAGLAGSLAAIALGMKMLGPMTLIQGPALIALGLGINVIAVAVKQFAGMKWEELGRGIAGMAAAIGAIGLALMLMPPTMVVQGLGLIALSFGVTMLAGAVTAFGSLDVDTLVKGIGGIALALIALSVAIISFPPTLALQAAGLVVLSVALSGIAGAIGLMGSLSIGTLVKGIVAMGAALGVLSVGLYLMIGSAPGALALIAAAGAFAVLGPAIALLGNLEWGTIFKGLAAIALTLGTLALVGALAVAPLTLLGAALLVLGIGLLPVAAGAYLLAKAFALLGDTGAKGVSVMVVAITAFVALIPKIIIDFLKGLGEVIGAVAELAPKVALALGIVIDSLLVTIIEAIPRLEEVIGRLLGAFTRILDANAMPIIQSGIRLLLGFLTGVSQNIGQVVSKGAEIVRKFLDGLAQNAPGLVESGLRAMTSFLTGISNGIPRIVGKVSEMVTKFLGAVTIRLPGIVAKGAEMVVKFINGVAGRIGAIVAAGTNLIVKFLEGVAQSVPRIAAKGIDVAEKFVNAVAKGAVRLVRIGFTAVIDFLNGTANAIRERGPELRKAGWNVADAILDGIVAGFKELGDKAVNAVKDLVSSLPNAAKKVLGIKSPSRVFAEIGKFSMLGLSKGLQENEKPIRDTATDIGSGLIGAFKDVLKIRSPSQVLKDIGKMVGEGFAQGLHGSKDDIRNSFKDLRTRLTDEMQTQRDALREENKKLEDLQQQHAEKMAEFRDLQRNPRKNAEEITSVGNELKDIREQIRESEHAIDTYQNVLDKTRTAHTALTKSLQDEKTKLIGMSKDLEGVTKNLELAQQELDKITQARADFIRTTTDQYSQLPDEGKLLTDALAEAEMAASEIAEKQRKKAEEDEKKRRIDQVANYKKALQEQIEATRKYQETLQKLRELGLDDATYRKLLSRGLEGQEFATQLAATGKDGVAQLNALDTELLKVSEGLALQSAENLYQAGVNAAQGLVDGLTARQEELKKAMDVLADAMVSRIKSALGIRSPSRVFAEVGKFLMDGLARGVQDNQNGVDSSIRSAAQKAVDAAKDSFGTIDMGNIMDVEPTITPVLDLSQVQKDATQLKDLTNVTPITAAASYGQASAISMEQAAVVEEASRVDQVAPVIQFEQNNTSPKALDEIEIYRQTNNQLAQLKSLVGLPVKYSA